MPAVIAPHPGAVSGVLHALDRVEEIFPPEIALTHNHVIVFRLMGICLLIPAEMKEPRIAENLGGVADHISNHPVVFACRHHTRIFAEPTVVGAGEVELGHERQPLGLETIDFRAHFVGRPAALDRKLGMRRKHKPFADIDQQRIVLRRRHAVGRLAPVFILEAQFAVALAPHIVAQMQQHRLDIALGHVLTP